MGGKTVLQFTFIVLSVMYCTVCRKDHEKCEFEVHEVYAVDVLVSTGEGKVCILTVMFQLRLC